MRIEYELLAGYKNLVNVGSCICEWISTSWFCGEVSSNPIHTIMWQRWTFNQFALSTNICDICGLLLSSKSTSSTSGQWTHVLTMACFVLQLWEASGSGNGDSPNCEVNFQWNACTFQDAWAADFIIHQVFPFFCIVFSRCVLIPDLESGF